MEQQPRDHLEATMAQMEGAGVGESGGGSQAVDDLDVDRGPTFWRWVLTAAAILVGLVVLAVPLYRAVGLLVSLAPFAPGATLVWALVAVLVLVTIGLLLVVAFWYVNEAA
jgi:uncharacterized membrane protein YdbT with pleckstrin-like domain